MSNVGEGPARPAELSSPLPQPRETTEFLVMIALDSNVVVAGNNDFLDVAAVFGEDDVDVFDRMDRDDDCRYIMSSSCGDETKAAELSDNNILRSDGSLTILARNGF